MRFIEKLSPLACVPDERGALAGVEFETARPASKVTLPARTLFVAAGTSPNVTYERERPGSFAIDPKTKAFQAFKAVRGDDGKLRLEPATGEEIGFFTSYLRDGQHGHASTATTTRATPGRSCARWRRRRTARRTSRRCSRATSPGSTPDGPARRATPPGGRSPASSTTSWRPTVALGRAADADDRRGGRARARRRAPLRARAVLPPAELRGAVARRSNGSRLMMEGLALTGAWVDKAEGPAVADRARDGRQLAPVRGPRRRASRSS